MSLAELYLAIFIVFMLIAPPRRPARRPKARAIRGMTLADQVIAAGIIAAAATVGIALIWS